MICRKETKIEYKKYGDKMSMCHKQVSSFSLCSTWVCERIAVLSSYPYKSAGCFCQGGKDNSPLGATPEKVL